MDRAIYILDYVNFQREVHLLVQHADQGLYSEVIERAHQVAEHTVDRDWILEGQGTRLRELNGLSGPSLVGFSFLVILSQHLQALSFNSPGLGNVARTMAHLGWSQADVQLLSIGMSMTALLKPGAEPNPLQRPPAREQRWYDPAYYWWWFRPAFAYSTGWWDTGSVVKLRRKLAGLEEVIGSLDVSTLGLHTSVTHTQLSNDYTQTLHLFALAEKEGRGVFYNVFEFLYDEEEDVEQALG